MVLRLCHLMLGLILYGLTLAMMVRSGLGLDPWDVLHEGLTRHVPLSFGQVVIAVGAVVLLLWWPLRQRPGIGTIANVVVVGIAVDAGLAIIARPEAMWQEALLLLGGIVGNGIAGAMYIGARLGPGPRDGLWLGLVERTGKSVRLWRTVIELSVLILGFLLGGTVGIGTILYAVSIGPIVQAALPWFDNDRPAQSGPATSPSGGSLSAGKRTRRSLTRPRRTARR